MSLPECLNYIAANYPGCFGDVTADGGCYVDLATCPTWTDDSGDESTDNDVDEIWGDREFTWLDDYTDYSWYWDLVDECSKREHPQTLPLHDDDAQ